MFWDKYYLAGLLLGVVLGGLGVIASAAGPEGVAWAWPWCKVIRIGKRVQPDISKARQQVNIDRPAYNKTDKQCRTRTTITAWLPDD